METDKKKSMSLRILELIGASGTAGMRFTDIQAALWAMGHAEPYTRDQRGYWCTNLLGGPFYHGGLLKVHCSKGTDGRWRLVRAPSATPWRQVTGQDAQRSV